MRDLERPIIDVLNVSVVENEATLVKPTNLVIASGLTALVGPNGAGKSTLGRVIHGLQHPTTGEVNHFGIGNGFDNLPEPQRNWAQRVTRACRLETRAERQAVRHRSRFLGFIAQEPLLNPSLTIQQNIELPHQIRENELDPDWYDHLVDRLEISGYLGRLAGTLSGGEAQGVAIAMALVHKPEFVFADEPTSALDSERTVDTIDLFLNVTREIDSSILYITHDAKVAEVADHTISMRDGVVTV